MNKNETSSEPQSVKKPRIFKIAVLIGAVLGAFFLWLYAIGYDDTLFERSISGISVEITGEESLREAMGFTVGPGQDFSSITVTAKGRQVDLSRYTASDFRAVVDISGVKTAGVNELPIQVYAPNGVTVDHQSSYSCYVFVDEFIQSPELISVTVDTGSNYYMSEGVAFVEAASNPMYVLVSGPKSVIESIGSASVVFNLDGVTIDKNISGYGNIELRDKNGNLIDNKYTVLSESGAFVTITVKKQKTVPVRVNLVGGMFGNSDVTVTVSPSTVKISGEAENVDAIEEIIIPIDETALDTDFKGEYSIVSLLPNGISNESGNSKINVNVILPKLTTRIYDIPAENIILENVPADKTVNVTQGLRITVMGAYGALDNIDILSLVSVKADYNKAVSEGDGKYTAAAYVTLGANSSGAYILNKEYAVLFTESTD